MSSDDLRTVLNQLAQLQAQLSALQLQHPDSIPLSTSSSTTSEVSESLSDSPSPFTSPDADIVLKTSDNVEFKVFSRILSEASPFFATMFTLPSPPSSSSTIDIPEESNLIDLLLRFIYPIPDPPIRSLSTLDALIATSIKYDLSGPLHTLRSLLLSPQFTSSDPFRLFCIAVRHSLSPEITLIIPHTFTLSLLEMPLTPSLHHISAHSFYRLLRLHQRRSSLAKEIIHSARANFKCPGCNATHLVNGGSSVYPSAWWNDWESRAFEELDKRPGTGVVFSPGFVARSAKAAMSSASSRRCQDCPADILNSQGSLDALRAKIDALSCEL